MFSSSLISWFTQLNKYRIKRKTNALSGCHFGQQWVRNPSKDRRKFIALISGYLFTFFCAFIKFICNRVSFLKKRFPSDVDFMSFQILKKLWQIWLLKELFLINVKSIKCVVLVNWSSSDPLEAFEKHKHRHAFFSITGTSWLLTYDFFCCESLK